MSSIERTPNPITALVLIAYKTLIEIYLNHKSVLNRSVSFSLHETTIQFHFPIHSVFVLCLEQTLGLIHLELFSYSYRADFLENNILVKILEMNLNYMDLRSAQIYWECISKICLTTSTA